MASSSKLLLVLCAGILVGACEQQPTTDVTALTDDNNVEVIPSAVTPDMRFASASTSFGDPLRGLEADDQELFAEGLEEFSEEEEPDEGLGPVFNEESCLECHNDPVGGTTGRLETRFGRRDNSGKFDPLEALGGSLIQDQGIGAVEDGFVFKAERVPRGANVVASRLTTPLFGAGLIDAVPDAELIELAQKQKRFTHTPGTANIVTDLATGQQKVGRFGWKAQVATLATFAGDAYLNEMGITNPIFPNESCPQGNCASLVHNPMPELNDSGPGIEAFKNFMTLLAPPPRGPGANRTGEELFQAIGCANCHTPKLATGPSPIAALDRKVFQPFSDFLVHDMGRLGDGITQGNVRGREMRTAPLWGLRVRPVFLHDGRATTVTAAILAHDGQGRRARERFVDLSSDKRRALLSYLNSL